MKLYLAAMLLVITRGAAPARADSVGNCHIGAYRLSDGSMVDVGPTDGEDLRWRRFDGTTGTLKQGADGAWTSSLGWTERPDGTAVAFADCAAGGIKFGGQAGQRIGFDVSEGTFAVRDGAKTIDLAGRLVLPKGSGKVPIVVLIHGSETSSARALYSLQRMLPAEGVGVFVYDKRGTGGSAGAYTQDFSVLADDAVAALGEARKRAGARAGRMGYQGGSQGGWVAPLAATRAAVDFVIVSFGLAVSPIEEDLQEIELEMKLAGHSAAETAKALEVARAGHVVMVSGFTTGFREYDAVRARYKHEPWYKDLRGNMTRFILPYGEAELREKGQAYRVGTPWNYDSVSVLRKVGAPQLWILGEDDLDAPSGETGKRIRGLVTAGRPITLAMFPRAEHGMTEYEIGAHGERVSTRYTAGYFAMMRDFIRDGHLSGHYGAAQLVTAAGH